MQIKTMIIVVHSSNPAHNMTRGGQIIPTMYKCDQISDVVLIKFNKIEEEAKNHRTVYMTVAAASLCNTQTLIYVHISALF